MGRATQDADTPVSAPVVLDTVLTIYILRSEIGLNGLNCRAKCAEVLRRVADGKLIDDQPIKTLFGIAFGLASS